MRFIFQANCVVLFSNMRLFTSLIAAVIILLMSPEYASSQGFASVGATWHFSEHGNGSAPYNAEFTRFRSVKDTLIKGITMHKVERLYFTRFEDTITMRPIFLGQVADTAYLYNEYEDRLKRIYVFNVSKGDTVVLDNPNNETTFTLVIDSLRQLPQASKPTKEYFGRVIKGEELTFTGHYIDRVGGVNWIVPRGAIIPESGGPIRCYEDEDVSLKFQEVDCDYLFTSVVCPSPKDQQAIYPNPTSGLFQVQPSEPLESLRLYSSQGALVHEAFQSGQVDVRELDEGVYYLHITLQSGASQMHKVIKY